MFANWFKPKSAVESQMHEHMWEPQEGLVSLSGSMQTMCRSWKCAGCNEKQFEVVDATIPK